MNPIEWKNSTVKFAEYQDECETLPAHVNSQGIVTSCWKASLKERIRVLFTGRVYLQVYTFNQPLQPLLMTTEDPISET